LPAPVINGGGDSLGKWLNFRLSRARELDLDLGSDHAAYRLASLITYIHNFIEIRRKNFRDSQLSLLPTSKSLDTKTRTKIKKSGPDKL